MTESQIRHDERERCAKMMDERAKEFLLKRDRVMDGPIVPDVSTRINRLDASCDALSRTAHMLRQIPAAEDANAFDHILLTDSGDLIRLDCSLCRNTCVLWRYNYSHDKRMMAAEVRAFRDNHSTPAHFAAIGRADQHIPVTRWLAEHGEKEEN